MLLVFDIIYTVAVYTAFSDRCSYIYTVYVLLEREVFNGIQVTLDICCGIRMNMKLSYLMYKTFGLEIRLNAHKGGAL